MPLKIYCKLYPWPSYHTLRWMIWKVEKTTGKDAEFVQRYGRRLLIEDKLFQDWIAGSSSRFLKDEWIEAARKLKADRKLRKEKHETKS